LGLAALRSLWQAEFMMNTATVRPASNARQIKAEVRQIRQAAREIASSKQAAIRFLASTGMHTRTGQLKPQFS
jgi:hypothetical protein